MLKMDRRLLQNVDWPLLGAALFIIGLSLFTITSIVCALAGSTMGPR